MDEIVQAPKKQSASAYYVRIIGTLFVITAIVSVLLALVNMVTKPTIDRLAAEKKQAAMEQVMPGAEFVPIDNLPQGIDGLVEMQLAKSAEGIQGYCVQVTTNGFGGAIDMMVGVDSSGAVTGVSILSMSETAGLGARAKESTFTDQYAGRTGEIGVSKTSADPQNIQAISGATITSKAVTLGVNNALAAVQAYSEGGSNG